MMEEMLKQIMSKLNDLQEGQKELKSGQDFIIRKLNSISEQEYNLKGLSEKVAEHDVDIKIIKKAIIS